MPGRLFTSRTRVKLLEIFLLHPEREVHVRETCRITGLNINAVRRDVGTTNPSQGEIQAMAQAAYNANPEAIPYESPRYRSWADLNHDGYISGPGELMPLYVAAARDFTQPIFEYGPPRLVRIGVEFEF